MLQGGNSASSETLRGDTTAQIMSPCPSLSSSYPADPSPTAAGGGGRGRSSRSRSRWTTSVLGPVLFFFLLQPLSSCSLSFWRCGPGGPGRLPPQRPGFGLYASGIGLALSSLRESDALGRWMRFANSTLGHADPTFALGLDLLFPEKWRKKRGAKSDSSSSSKEEQQEEEEELEEDPPEDESQHVISLEEMEQALSQAHRIMTCTSSDIQREGWKIVHQNHVFTLYKRRQQKTVQGSKESHGEGPVEYMMTGQFADVSPRTFLLAQIDCSLRRLWDRTMKEMSLGTIELDVVDDDPNVAGGAQSGRLLQTRDVLYYRTKWPWPMKDRDYALARRCKIFDRNNTIVLISKATESAALPHREGVVRVDNYWCHSAFASFDPLAQDKTPPSPPPPIPPVTPSPPSVEEEMEEPEQGSDEEELDLFHEVEGEELAAIAARRSSLVNAFAALRRKESRVLRRLRCGRSRKVHEVKERMLLRLIHDLSSPSPAPSQQGELTLIDENSNPTISSKEEEVESARTGRRRRRRGNLVCRPGMRFVTIFCDDQKVPLPPRLVDMLSKMAEKVVPESFSRLHEVAKEVELGKLLPDKHCRCQDEQ
eukprot:gene6261-6902_t